MQTQTCQDGRYQEEHNGGGGINAQISNSGNSRKFRHNEERGDSGRRQAPRPTVQLLLDDDERTSNGESEGRASNGTKASDARRQAPRPTGEQVPFAQLTDVALVRRVLGGEQDAFNVLMERYHPLLYRFAYHFLGEYDQSCDVVQHVFVQLYISLPHLLAGDQLKSWLLRVTQNSCLDELRKRHRRRVTVFSALENAGEDDDLSPLSTLADDQPQPEEIAEFNELQGLVFQAIQNLPSRFRHVVLLRYVHQYSFAEIGETLQMPTTTAKTYYYRACARLRNTLPSPH